MVRCKFRCLSIHYSFRSTKVELLPVIAKADGFPNGSEENARFWEATPQGEAEVVYPEHVAPDFELRGYYFLDIEPDPDGAYKLIRVARVRNVLEVELETPYNHDASPRTARLSMTIAKPDSWDCFPADLVGTPYRVKYTPTTGDHEGCPYTG